MHGTEYSSVAPGATSRTCRARPTTSSTPRNCVCRRTPVRRSIGKRVHSSTITTRGLRSIWRTPVFFPPGGVLLQNSVTSHSTRNEGVFAEAGFPLTDTLSLTAGARYDHTKVVTGETNTTGLGAGRHSVAAKRWHGDWNKLPTSCAWRITLPPATCCMHRSRRRSCPVTSRSAPVRRAHLRYRRTRRKHHCLQVSSKNRFLDATPGQWCSVLLPLWWLSAICANRIYSTWHLPVLVCQFARKDDWRGTRAPVSAAEERPVWLERERPQSLLRGQAAGICRGRRAIQDPWHRPADLESFL